LKKYISKKIIKPLLPYLNQGMSPEKLAFTLSLGICFGIIPVLGLNAILLAIMAFMFRLNLPAIQLINFGV
jgi:uncharacterized protein (DUF2062 family)